MAPSEIIDRNYLAQLEALPLPSKPLGDWMVLHKCGDGKEWASRKFNFQVYERKNGVLTLVTNDFETLENLLQGKERVSEEGKRIIAMDDSGWGYPLGGVLCGAHDSETGQKYWREIEVAHFQGTNFRPRKTYLQRYAERALEIVYEIKPEPQKTIVRICTGYINTKARQALRERDFFVVEVDEIGEPLQSWLERRHKEYIKDLAGRDIYFDPKGMPNAEVAQRFYGAVDFARTHDLMHLAKTGWEYFHGRMQA